MSLSRSFAEFTKVQRQLLDKAEATANKLYDAVWSAVQSNTAPASDPTVRQLRRSLEDMAQKLEHGESVTNALAEELGIEKSTAIAERVAGWRDLLSEAMNTASGAATDMLGLQAGTRQLITPQAVEEAYRRGYNAGYNDSLADQNFDRPRRMMG